MWTWLMVRVWALLHPEESDYWKKCVIVVCILLLIATTITAKVVIE